MKTSIRGLWALAMAITIINISPSAFAGGDSGGGGGAVRCTAFYRGYANHNQYNYNGFNGQPGYVYQQPPMNYLESSSIQLLEFWEAENGYLPFQKKIIIPASEDPVELQITKALNRIKQINSVLGNEVEKALAHVKNRKFYDPNTRIKAPSDTVQPLTQKGCELVGIGDFFDGRQNLYYENDNLERLSIDEEYLNLMPLTHQAGFWMHEAIYYVFRNFSHHLNSVSSRILNVLAFSDETLPNISKKPKNATRSYHCSKNGPGPNGPYDSVEIFVHKINGNFYIAPKNMINTVESGYGGGTSRGAAYMFERVISQISVNSPSDSGSYINFGSQSDFNEVSGNMYDSCSNETCGDIYGIAKASFFVYGLDGWMIANLFGSNTSGGIDLVCTPY